MGFDLGLTHSKFECVHGEINIGMCKCCGWGSNCLVQGLEETNF